VSARTASLITALPVPVFGRGFGTLEALERTILSDGGRVRTHGCTMDYCLAPNPADTAKHKARSEFNSVKFTFSLLLVAYPTQL
jgi:hypothetical protein